MEYVTLNNGVKMPVLGYGVFRINAEDTESHVLDAIRVGYRLIDTAQIYGNEEGVGKAVKKSGVPGEGFFLTTKIWITNETYQQTLRSIDGSLRRLHTDHIDLLLIHQPYGDYYGNMKRWERRIKWGKPGRSEYLIFISQDSLDLRLGRRSFRQLIKWKCMYSNSKDH